MPAISPPPPTATTSVSSRGTGLQHLEPDGALAGDDRLVVVGMHESRGPRCGASASACARASSNVSPCSTTSAPKLRVRSTFTPRREARHHDHRAHPQPLRVVGDALRVVARAHRDHAARALVVGELAPSLFHAPRSLNDAVNCRFSNFRKTCAPVISDSVRDSTHGVSSTCPCRRASRLGGCRRW